MLVKIEAICTYISHTKMMFHASMCNNVLVLFLLRWRMSFFFYMMTQYVCAQGKGIRVLFVFDLVRIPH